MSNELQKRKSPYMRGPLTEPIDSESLFRQLPLGLSKDQVLDLFKNYLSVEGSPVLTAGILKMLVERNIIKPFTDINGRNMQFSHQTLLRLASAARIIFECNFCTVVDYDFIAEELISTSPADAKISYDLVEALIGLSEGSYVIPELGGQADIDTEQYLPGSIGDVEA